MRLVFIEGVSGVGKSTITQKICDKLSEQGFSVNRWLEFDFPNPIDFYCTAYFKQDSYSNLLTEFSEYADDIKANTVAAGDVKLVRYYNRKIPLFTKPLLDVLGKHEFCYRPSNPVPLLEYTRVYKMVWEKFVQETSGGFDFVLFDGALFHHPINDLRSNYNASCDKIINHIKTLLNTIDTLSPIVIYLSADNVSERLRKARISREETPPSVEQIHFWEERKRIDTAVMPKLSVQHYFYDISRENWDSFIDDMAKNITKMRG